MRQKVRAARCAWTARAYAEAIRRGDTPAGARRASSLGRLAVMVGVSAQTILNWERGGSWPNRAKFEKFSEIVGVPFEELIKEEP